VISLRRLPDRWRRVDVTVRDLPFALLVATASLVPWLHNYGTRLGDLPDRRVDALVAGVVLLECLPLAVRRRWPAACLALVSIGFAIDQLRGYHTVAGTALPIAVMSAGAWLDRGRRVTVILATVAYVPLAIALDRAGSPEGVAGFVTFYIFGLALFWGIGVWLRQTRAVEAERRRHVAEATRLAERTRIARELHDVVTHHVTAIVVQANAARFVAGPGPAADTLKAIGDTGRQALTELRDLLGVLDPTRPAPRDRLPGLGQVGELVASTRAAGQPVTLAEEGTLPEMGAGRELAAYRVVQESLTNALKYAAGQPTAVELTYRPDAVTITVHTGRASTGPGGGSGRGLAGLRERVELFGGELTAGPRADGGFLVHARVPVGGTT